MSVVRIAGVLAAVSLCTEVLPMFSSLVWILRDWQ